MVSFYLFYGFKLRIFILLQNIKDHGSSQIPFLYYLWLAMTFGNGKGNGVPLPSPRLEFRVLPVLERPLCVLTPARRIDVIMLSSRVLMRSESNRLDLNLNTVLLFQFSRRFYNTFIHTWSPEQNLIRLTISFFCTNQTLTICSAN